MKPKRFEVDPRFMPHQRACRTRSWLRLVAMLLVLASYLGLAGLQDGPIQVWLLVLAPLAMLALALALLVTGDPASD